MSEKIPSSDVGDDLTAAQRIPAWVLRRAIAVFGDRAGAMEWFSEPAPGLRGRRPVEVMTTVEGIGRVQTLLGRIEHGVYS